MVLDLFGPVVSEGSVWIYEMFEIPYISTAKVKKFIDTAEGKDLEVRINSCGGEVFSGFSIYTMLKEYPGNVTVKVFGLAGSAASLIAMAGDTVEISPPAQIMVHNAQMRGGEGDYRDYESSTEALKSINRGIINAYKLKTGMDETELQGLMDKETYLSAQEALKYGFADKIMFNEEGKLVASVNTGDIIPESIINKLRNERIKREGEDIMSALLNAGSSPTADSVETVKIITNETSTAKTADSVENLVEDAKSVEAGKEVITETPQSPVSEGSASVESLVKEVAKLEAEIVTLKAENARLLEKEPIADAYKESLVEDALAWGVRLYGNTFKKDFFKNLFDNSEIGEIQNFISDFKGEAQNKLPDGRVSEDGEPRVENNVPSREDEAEFRNFVAGKAAEYAEQNKVSISEATRIMYNQFSKENEEDGE